MTNSQVNLDGVEERLVYFPISFFAIVMGLSGLTIAWRAAGGNIGIPISYILGSITSCIMLVIFALYTKKFIHYKDAVIEELKHPIRINFFPAFSISLLLLSVVWQDFPTASFALWGVGAILQLLLTLYVMSSWIHHTHYTLAHANPSWFIPVVGNIIVPITGSAQGYHELSWFFFSIGIMFWLILLTIVFYRLFFHDPLPPKLVPMLFILLAPPSVGFVSYTSLVGEIDVFARILFYVALFLALLLTINLQRFMKIPFFISSWAYSFPIAALTIATAKMSHFTQSLVFIGLSKLMLCVLTLLLAWLVVRTIRAIKAKAICQPE